MRARLAVLGLTLIGVGVLMLVVFSRRAVLIDVDGRSGVAPDRALASRARGAYLFQRGARCAACHAADLGGRIVIDDPRIAELWGPNLTRGNPSVGVAYADADFERAIRRGLRPSGQRLLGMPSWDYARMPDADVASLIAYIRAAPAVPRGAPAFRLGILGRVQLLTGSLAFDADRVPDAIERAVLPRGLAVARVAGCLRCHAEDGMPAPPPLPHERAGSPLRALAPISYRVLADAVRRARAADGAPIAAHGGSALAAQLDDTDLQAICSYVDRTFSNGAPPGHGDGRAACAQ